RPGAARSTFCVRCVVRHAPLPKRVGRGDAGTRASNLARKTLDLTDPMLHPTDDLRIERIRPLIPPAILMENLPLSERASTTVAEGRDAAGRILRGEDDRLLVVVGPCSIHDVTAAREYARGLHAAAAELADALFVVMRVY